jgi:FAD/FMN-containing dehydrogenase
MSIADTGVGLIAYEEKKRRLVERLRGRQDGSAVHLGKDTSNLFRDRRKTASRTLDVRDFNHVLGVDRQELSVEVEGMTPYAVLVDACLAHDVMPPVVPQLKSITIGGAVTGIGIESSSFKYGLVHETIREMEILLGDGDTVICTPDNAHRELFFGFANSYGTLGYALKLRSRVVPVKPFVKLTHFRHTDAEDYFRAVGQWCDRKVDFVDGTVFGPGEYYLTVGEFVDEAPYRSDYTYERIYYRSIREREEDYLTIRDYLWRWDTDWFWCSKNVFAQHPLIRRLYGRSRLNSVTYTRIMRWNSRWKLMALINQLRGVHTESVIQDVDIPVERCTEFLDFYFDTIQFTPVWICPFRAYDEKTRFPLYPTDPAKLYVNFGFWDSIQGPEKLPEGHYNRLVEHKVTELGGIKSLYSDAFYTLEEFWRIFNRPYYKALKERYDPNGTLKDLYDKCVLKA